MITRDDLVRHILAYLNGESDLAALVHWSEDALFTIAESNEDTPDAPTLIQVLGYIGAGDTPDFPLTWDVLSGFLEELDTRIRVVVTAA